MKGAHYQGPRYRRDGSGIIRVSVEDIFASQKSYNEFRKREAEQGEDEPTNGRWAAAEDDRRWAAADPVDDDDPPMFDSDEGSGGESEAERREADDR